MSDLDWLGGGALVIGGVLLLFAWRWYRRRRTAKAADRLLADVLKSKDAFRR